MTYSLGIDFGTTNTRVAIRPEGSLPIALPIGETGNLFMPSVVRYQQTGAGGGIEVDSVGEAALSAGRSDDTIVIEEVKRCLAEPDPTARISYPWWDEKASKISLWGRNYDPQTVIYDILAVALERATRLAKEIGIVEEIDRLNVSTSRLRLGTAVTAGLRTRKKLAETMNRLGFSGFRVSQIVEEPVLASLSYEHLLQLQAGEKALVFDLGGGTFDVAIISVDSESNLSVLATDGEPFLGGADIDRAMYHHLKKRVAEEIFGLAVEEFDEFLGPIEKNLIQNQARDIKVILSLLDKTSLTLTNFLGEQSVDIDVTRSELEEVVEETLVVDRSIECTLRAFKRAMAVERAEIATYDDVSGLRNDSVQTLDHQDLRDSIQRRIIVGGSTQMPMIRDRLSELWGVEGMVSDEAITPMTASVLGAAMEQETSGGTAAGHSAVVDRLPFSILLGEDEKTAQELYRAFDQACIHKTLTTQPEIEPYRRNFEASKSTEDASILVVDPDGLVLSKDQFVYKGDSTPCLEIDRFGRCVIVSNGKVSQEIANPARHQMQRDAEAKYLERQRVEKEKEQARLRKQVRGNPFLDNQ